MAPEFDHVPAMSWCADELWKSALEIEGMREALGKVFDLLILARNSKDEEALQEAIDMVAVLSCKSLDF